MPPSLKIVAVHPLETITSQPIPFSESLIAAGFPSAIENFSEQALDLNDLLIHHPASTFFVRVSGDSMINAGINSNDILIVDRSLPVLHNKIAVVRIHDEFTVKRLKLIGSTIQLVAENDQYKPIEIKPETDFEVWGIVTFVIHQVS
ncbi:MAG: translesion error-prone DNA polymerase V autoproteolytic subunit [Candidatus Dependentiae bacterium]|nr:translesion error-prone DNA polymerase V autoproteolytic subunit [Candidatus Dependentiae bacterium]